MSRGFNLLFEPDTATPFPHSGADAQPFVHRFSLELRCESAREPWHATLTTPDGRHRLEFDSPDALMRTLSQLSVRPRVEPGSTPLF